MSETRKCTGCGESKDLETSFSKESTARGGRRMKCNACRNKVRNAWRARRKATKDLSEHNYGKDLLPEGFGLSGVSQLSDADGNVKLTWAKSKADKSGQTAMLMEAMRTMLEGFTGIVEPTQHLEPATEDNLCVVMPIGDLHVGMHAWAEETGGRDNDLKICRRNMATAVHDLLSTAPRAKQAVLINLGDYFHADSANNTTTKGTPVDVDGRRVKVVKTGLEIFINIIREALANFELVHVICVTGNHDGESSKMLALMLELMFNNEPRVTIETAPRKFHRFVWGKCLLATTHGDTGKDAELPMIMATDWKADWSYCEYFRWYKGHVHHDSMKEYTGRVIVETFRTMTPSDAWHSGQGYRSGQSLKIDVWDKEWGHVQRNEIGIRRVERLNEDQECTD